MITLSHERSVVIVRIVWADYYVFIAFAAAGCALVQICLPKISPQFPFRSWPPFELLGLVGAGMKKFRSFF